MNKRINISLILIVLIFSCSEDGAIIISNIPNDLPDQNYKINLHSNSGSFLETVTIYWDETEGIVELTDSGIPTPPPSGNSHTFSGMTPGEFRDIIIEVDDIYVDSIQIFTRPVYPVSNFQYEIDKVGVKEAYCGKQIVMKRFRPRAKGRAAPIKKPYSNLTIILSEMKKVEKHGTKS